MAIYRKYKTIIFIIFSIASVWVLWNFGLKEIYLNHTFRTIQITSLENSKWLNLSKWKDQAAGQTYGIELEINGSTDRTIQVLFGQEKNGMMQQVLLKKGTIDFEFMRDWYSDSCYLFFPSVTGAKVNLDINYRFLGSSH